jgi:hypothetical protein
MDSLDGRKLNGPLWRLFGLGRIRKVKHIIPLH